MKSIPLNTELIFQHWIEMSDNDYDAMIDLYNSKRYNWSLFIGHLVIEKLLKASYVKHNMEHPPLTHNLLKLALKSGFEIADEMKLQLDTITTFNMNARYDDYKMEFYKKCTDAFSTYWIDQIKNLRLWIKQQLIA